MTVEEFTSAIRGFEVAYGTTKLSEADNAARRALTFEVIEQFPIAVLKEARKLLATDGRVFFPTPGEFLAACEAVVADSAPAPAKPAKRYPPIAHDCAVAPRDSEALSILRTLEPDEARHVTCSGATPVCQGCGRKQKAQANATIALLIEKFPQQTQGWKVEAKVWQTCTRCTNRGKK